MPIPRTVPLAGVIALLSLAASTPAALIVEYRFTSSSYSPTTQHPLVTADDAFDDVMWGGGITGMRGITASAGVGDSFSLYTRSTGVDSSITPTDYVGFTLAADPGKTLDLTDVAFYYTFNGGTGYTATFTLRSSLDGYTADLAQFVKPSSSGGYNAGWTSTGPIALGSAFGNIASVGFRIFLSDDVESNTYSLRLDNLTVNGEVIPEPASAALLGLVALAFLRCRRPAHGA
ncbi:MAG: hypothetical protein BWZ02_02856 [Lentisphaerae bacterium ADurb.BinA184]|nr:MAG: hypothetical protein BWZ02_02856 [Lentisphaerae bacterium ADurb.BinA184]